MKRIPQPHLLLSEETDLPDRKNPGSFKMCRQVPAIRVAKVRHRMEKNAK